MYFGKMIENPPNAFEDYHVNQIGYVSKCTKFNFGWGFIHTPIGRRRRRGRVARWCTG